MSAAWQRIITLILVAVALSVAAWVFSDFSLVIMLVACGLFSVPWPGEEEEE